MRCEIDRQLGIFGAELCPVGSTAKVGDVVVLDYIHLDERSPLFGLTQPSFFFVLHVTVVNYTLRDLVTRDHIAVSISECGDYLYPVEKWGTCISELRRREVKAAKTKINLLEHDKELLKEILSATGFRLVSENEARQLEIVDDIAISRDKES